MHCGRAVRRRLRARLLEPVATVNVDAVIVSVVILQAVANLVMLVLWMKGDA